MIADFGRDSFVTHTTSLKERIQKAEKESKMPDREIIYEAECPACCEMVEFYNIGWKICPHCKGAKAEFGITWEITEEQDNG